MGFGGQDKLLQTQMGRGHEDEVEVLEGLGKEKASGLCFSSRGAYLSMESRRGRWLLNLTRWRTSRYSAKPPLTRQEATMAWTVS